MSRLGDKSSILLLRFPYSFKPDQRLLLSELLDEMPDGHKMSIELKNRNWLKDNLFVDLEHHGIGHCLVEHSGSPGSKSRQQIMYTSACSETENRLRLISALSGLTGPRN